MNLFKRLGVRLDLRKYRQFSFRKQVTGGALETDKVHNLQAKVVLVGLPGRGKLQILRDWSNRLSDGKVID